MTKIYRHGEVGFVKIESLPDGLTESKTDTIVRGSHGNGHTFTGGTLYLLSQLDGFVLGYLQAYNTKLYHPEHSPNGAELPDGVYEIRKQQEYTPEGLVPVID